MCVDQISSQTAQQCPLAWYDVTGKCGTTKHTHNNNHNKPNSLLYTWQFARCLYITLFVLSVGETQYYRSCHSDNMVLHLFVYTCVFGPHIGLSPYICKHTLQENQLMSTERTILNYCPHSSRWCVSLLDAAVSWLYSTPQFIQDKATIAISLDALTKNQVLGGLC